MPRHAEADPERRTRRSRSGFVFAAGVLTILIAMPVAWLGGLIWFAETIPETVEIGRASCRERV